MPGRPAELQSIHGERLSADGEASLVKSSEENDCRFDPAGVQAMAEEAEPDSATQARQYGPGELEIFPGTEPEDLTDEEIERILDLIAYLRLLRQIGKYE